MKEAGMAGGLNGVLATNNQGIRINKRKVTFIMWHPF